ncbi:putative Ribonuclease Oy [Hypsibius exemplaris]|uniref:Ribonuclease Oy n=1 Tax=Hypsibius exemplaris TaxID=2072580 RepID=A0A1W0WSU0_HYPEX|nr:putative Ribonuclease Oy [Hypsibius exemplaris]
MNAVIAVFLGLMAVVSAGALVVPHQQQQQSGDNDWDFILFVQRWPASACVNGHVTGGQAATPQKCSFPPEMAPNAWLMHGIWPTKTGTEGPVNCDKTAKWDINPVEPLVPELKADWSNLESNTTYDSFWSHEWLKHGTCAQNLPALVGEFNFFNVPLTLREKYYDFHAALANKNILPDANRKYSHDAFAAALQTAYGSTAEVWCAYDKGTKEHYVAEIRLCLTKTFDLMDCPDSEVKPKSTLGTSSCPTSQELIYAPVKPTGVPILPRPTRPTPQ